MVFARTETDRGVYRGMFVQSQFGVHVVFRRMTAVTAADIETNAEPLAAYLAPMRRGLVLVCGPIGPDTRRLTEHMTNWLAEHRTAHMVVLEDCPATSPHTHNSVVHRMPSQRGDDGKMAGLRLAEFVQPDVLVVPEIRTQSCFETLMRIAEGESLVVANLEAHDFITVFDQLQELGGSRTLAKLAFTLQMVVFRKRLDATSPDGRPNFEDEILANSHELADIFLRCGSLDFS